MNSLNWKFHLLIAVAYATLGYFFPYFVLGFIVIVALINAFMAYRIERRYKKEQEMLLANVLNRLNGMIP